MSKVMNLIQFFSEKIFLINFNFSAYIFIFAPFTKRLS